MIRCQSDLSEKLMNSKYNFQYFQGSSLSDLFAQDITDASYGFILNWGFWDKPSKRGIMKSEF
ncbi:hypothetical protein CDG79_15570 [Nostoc sp. 'Peltigera membranacea cyanobiont' 232]|nr:hypothetical protein CDG79_15570 [Nostoc sp. 'Peltigera membranacea cyanobiont' 232]